MRKSIMMTALAMAALARNGPARADFFSLNGQNYTTQFNTGSGENHSLLVLEFGATAYDFGYAWSGAAGSKTGYDMLADITANSAGKMSITQEFFQLDPPPAPAVPFVEAVGYLTNQPAYSFPLDLTAPGFSWFGYFNADNGEDWAASDVGAANRALQNNSADDWVYQDIAPDDQFNARTLPAVAVAVPEPASIAMLATGAILLAQKRRR